MKLKEISGRRNYTNKDRKAEKKYFTTSIDKVIKFVNCDRGSRQMLLNGTSKDQKKKKDHAAGYGDIQCNPSYSKGQGNKIINWIPAGAT
jgi:hypothetical protein